MSTRLTTILCLVLILAIVGAAVRAQGSEAHSSDYCGTGLNVTGSYAVSFEGQKWRTNADGSKTLLRKYRHYKRVGETSQFLYDGHTRWKVCGGIA